jgi:hypothetical protein
MYVWTHTHTPVIAQKGYQLYDPITASTMVKLKGSGSSGWVEGILCVCVISFIFIPTHTLMHTHTHALTGP